MTRSGPACKERLRRAADRINLEFISAAYQLLQVVCDVLVERELVKGARTILDVADENGSAKAWQVRGIDILMICGLTLSTHNIVATC